MSEHDHEQLDLGEYAAQLADEQAEREAKARRRAFVVFATDPERAGEDDYKLVFACEAATPAEAVRKVRPVAGDERRVSAYLASGRYKDELPQARWVA
jgi:hypothetical protein